MRELAAKALRRGSVSATLSVKRTGDTRFTLDPAALDQALALALDLHKRLPGSQPPRAEALLALPGVLRQVNAEADVPDSGAHREVRAGFEKAIAALVAARQEEGARLTAVITRLLEEIGALHAAATSQAADQPAQQRRRMLDAIASLLAEQPSLPEERVAQEVALLAARSDVREELDRLASHIQAARDLLTEDGAVGRRFDFLVQEFNREANTLCSKSASPALTATGLQLKAAIERVREQVQNIE